MVCLRWAGLDNGMSKVGGAGLMTQSTPADKLVRKVEYLENNTKVYKGEGGRLFYGPQACSKLRVPRHAYVFNARSCALVEWISVVCCVCEWV